MKKIVVGILIGIILCCLVFLGYELLNKKEDNKPNKDNNIKEEVKLSYYPNDGVVGVLLDSKEEKDSNGNVINVKTNYSNAISISNETNKLYIKDKKVYLGYDNNEIPVIGIEGTPVEVSVKVGTAYYTFAVLDDKGNLYYSSSNKQFAYGEIVDGEMKLVTNINMTKVASNVKTLMYQVGGYTSISTEIMFKDENNNVKHLGRNTTGFVISNENITDPYAK